MGSSELKLTSYTNPTNPKPQTQTQKSDILVHGMGYTYFILDYIFYDIYIYIYITTYSFWLHDVWGLEGCCGIL